MRTIGGGEAKSEDGDRRAASLREGGVHGGVGEDMLGNGGESACATRYLGGVSTRARKAVEWRLFFFAMLLPSFWNLFLWEVHESSSDIRKISDILWVKVQVRKREHTSFQGFEV